MTDTLVSEGAASFSLDAQTILDTQLNEWFESWLTAGTRQRLSQAGFSNAEIDDIWMLYYFESPYNGDGTYPQFFSERNAAFHSHGDEIAQLLPEPNENVALVACGMLLALLSRRARTNAGFHAK